MSDGKGIASGRYLVLLSLPQGTASAIAEDASRSPNQRTTALGIALGYGEDALGKPDIKAVPAWLNTRNDILPVRTDNPEKLHGAVFFDGAERTYRTNFGVNSFRIA